MRRTLLTASVCLGVAIASPALADEAANTATARALGIEGVTLADAGKCREAIEKLERAEQLRHAPTTATRLGECEIEVGRLVAGTERLQRVVREPLGPNAHPAFVAAVARAQKSLDAALPRIPAVRISVVAPRGAAIALAIDGEPTPVAVLDTNRRIDPGSHRIEVRAPGYLPASAAVSLDEGETKDVSLELSVDPHAAPIAGRPSGADARRDASRPSKVPAILAYSVGAVGLAVGIGAGAVTARKASDLESSCDPNRVCAAGRASEITDAKTWATVSTIGFATAGAGLVAGTVLLLMSPGKSAPPKTGTRVTPSVGVMSVGLDGVF